MLARANKSAGFTLLEMVVTMGIFAILVAVGVPAMRTWVANTKVRAVADSLQNGLRLAQSESLRLSRQVVFSLTNSTTPTVLPATAVTNGLAWTLYTIPVMAGETNQFIESGLLSSSSAVAITAAQAAICFNSVGRLVSNTTAGVTAVTGASTCALPNTGNPPVLTYVINVTGADRPLTVTVALGGQVHMCDPAKAFSNTNPDGC